MIDVLTLESSKNIVMKGPQSTIFIALKLNVKTLNIKTCKFTHKSFTFRGTYVIVADIMLLRFN